MFRFACLVALVGFSTLVSAADLPRYRLPVGRVLYYSGESSSKEKDANVPASSSSSNFRVTVLAENSDGSARVLVRSTKSYTHQGRAGEETVSSAVLDLFPDGRCRMDRSMETSFSPATLFPRLPADEQQVKGTWQREPDWSGTRTTFTAQASKEGEFVFSGVQDGPTNRIYLVSQKGTNHFDTAKGVIVRIESELSQDYGFHSKGTATIKLGKEESMPAEQVAALARDVAVYIDAVKQSGEKTRTIQDDPDKGQEIVAAAKAILTAGADKVANEDVKKEFTARLNEHERYANEMVEEAKRLAGVLKKPAADWSSKDLNDQPISLQGLRGKVIVMDFWYRGCGWCMYAMPQVKQLAADFKDKPVAVLGMNTDRNLEDARFVVKELGLDYPQVQATGIPEKFGVHGFPTLIIIDQQGLVRDVHVGYTPDLRERVSKKIQELLKTHDAAP